MTCLLLLTLPTLICASLVSSIPCDPDERYPHPLNCSLFYLCGKDSNPNLFMCPKGLQYNFNSSSCDWPDNVQCVESKDKDTSEKEESAEIQNEESMETIKDSSSKENSTAVEQGKVFDAATNKSENTSLSQSKEQTSSKKNEHEEASKTITRERREGDKKQLAEEAKIGEIYSTMKSTNKLKIEKDLEEIILDEADNVTTSNQTHSKRDNETTPIDESEESAELEIHDQEENSNIRIALNKTNTGISNSTIQKKELPTNPFLFIHEYKTFMPVETNATVKSPSEMFGYQVTKEEVQPIKDKLVVNDTAINTHVSTTSVDMSTQGSIKS